MMLTVADVDVAQSRVCDAEMVDGVNWSKTRAGGYDLQPCPPSFTGRQSVFTRGVATGGYMGYIYPPKIRPSTLFMG